MRNHPQLGAGHVASHIPAGAGAWALIWKDWVQTARRIDIKSAISWLAIFGSDLGMMIALDWETRIWVFVVWGLLIGQVCSKRFSSDLNHWVIFRQLPFSGRDVLLVEIARPVIGTTILSWFAFGISSLIGFHPSLQLAVLAPGIILCITLAAIYDILRQCKVDTLLAGRAAEMGAVGLFFGLIVSGLPLSLVVWITSRMSAGINLWVISLLGLFLSLGIAYGMWHLTASKYKNLK